MNTETQERNLKRPPKYRVISEVERLMDAWNHVLRVSNSLSAKLPLYRNQSIDLQRKSVDWDL